MNHPRGLNLMFLLVPIHEILLKSLLPHPRHTLFSLSGDNAVHLYIVSVNHYVILRTLNYIDHLEDIEFLLCNYMASILLTSLLIFLFVVEFYYIRNVLFARIANLYNVSVEIHVELIRFG